MSSNLVLGKFGVWLIPRSFESGREKKRALDCNFFVRYRNDLIAQLLSDRNQVRQIAECFATNDLGRSH